MDIPKVSNPWVPATEGFKLNMMKVIQYTLMGYGLYCIAGSVWRYFSDMWPSRSVYDAPPVHDEE